ncbi:nitronate monooxygenase [Mycobacterium koreense]|uniref:Propionate 3-nitronate monooxygenase n=2 Tax=Mycolicibacillus koreensis TaxID=1069220 RepID=A0A7I7SBS2_9MYCO|nr:nitronate monooxygenase [Mycolicibacillus koreensis]MCV7246797.1 nitronate monooxygenase [Mycolicibacillus koreensis]ODR07634.1 2-nitropropane dioxygenase [Mycolicibacillus koreensis]OSC35412.1 2-nitropropane dioxygenase [Mycolicibacillus koreensis]BBY54337.1 oxidoreductase [Mycolicibacillus koreensis]
MFAVTDLPIPIVAAPMAGGPSTVDMAVAVSEAGGLGFIAGGYVSPQRLADDLAAAAARSSAPIGVNLFVPQPSTATPAALDRYAEALAPLADRYRTRVGAPEFDDDGWEQKLEAVADARPAVVSFTFGTPARDVLTALAHRGIATLVTVTSVDEAAAAVDAGAGGLVVQGPGAGGHRGTFDPDAEPATVPLTELLTAIGAAHSVPVIAAGGLADPADIAAARRAGACAAQVGTALLLADEAGTNPVHRAALAARRSGATVVTRAFSGRWARSLTNTFTAGLSPLAPAGYPQVNRMTAPIRAAAVAAGDPDGTSLWAGVGHAATRPGPAAEIIAALAG